MNSLTYCLYLILLIVLATTSCIEPIDIETGRQPERYIIEGLLSDNPDLQFIKIKQIPENEPGYLEVSGVTVLIETSNGIELPFEETTLGTYEPEQYIDLEADKQYRLVAHIGDSIQVVSDWQTVPPDIPLANAYFEPHSQLSINDYGYSVPTNGFAYFITTGFSSTRNTYIRYSYQSAYIMESPLRSPLCSECTGCYIIADAKDFVKTGAIENGLGKKLLNYKIGFVPASYEYSIRKTLRVFQFSINKDTYNYYALIEQQKTLEGTIFDPPPATLIGNLKDIKNTNRVVYGFFEVNTVNEASVAVSSSDSPFRLRQFGEICSPFNLNTNPQCADCRLKEGATHERPIWF